MDEKTKGKDTLPENQKLRENAVAPEKDQTVPPQTNLENKEAAEQKESSPCEKATEALLVRVEALERELAELKKPKESVKQESPQSQQSTPEILTKEGFWKRFHQLRSEGLSKNDAFRLTSLEVIEATSKLPK